MSTIDHAAESERITEHLGENVLAQEGITDATIIAATLDALRHATLALVEEQRTSNLIAYVNRIDSQFNWADEHPGSFDETTRAAALKRHEKVQQMIRERLGLA